MSIMASLQPHNSNGVYCTVKELLFEGRRSKAANLHLRRASSSLKEGGKRGRIRGRGMEFFESRPYVAQDEMRSIDWKVSARLNGLFTKVYVEERSRPVFLAIDQRSNMFFGSVNCFKSVLAAKIAARLATAAINGGDFFGGIVFDEVQDRESALSKERTSLARFFGLLALATEKKPEYKRDASSTWLTVLSKIINQIPGGSAVFLVSDFLGFGQQEQELLYRLRKKADIFALFVFDPLEAELPSLGTVGMGFGVDEIIFDSNNRLLSKKYRTWFKEKNDRLLSMFTAQNIPLLSFSTADDLDVAMSRIFQGRW